MDIIFLVADQQKSHEGVVRPFINFAKALRNKYELSFLLLNCSSDFSEQIKKSSFQLIEAQNQNEAIVQLRSLKPRFLFTDDDLQRLRITQKICKKINAQTISYVQILYGSHSIAKCFDLSSLTPKERLRFNSTRYVPFAFFSSQYTRLLKEFDLIIANSKVTATFLNSIYNIEPSGIVYPSVDTDIFQPSSKKTKPEVTLYLGSHLGDSRGFFVKKIVATVVENGYLVNLFGNARLASEIVKESNDQVLYNLSLTDAELAKMYSRSKLTICPQKWEQFGLVPVESQLCGTPVLAFNCMGFQETIDETSGWLVHNEDDFLNTLSDVLKKEQLPFQGLREIAVRKFSIDASGGTLKELLEKYISNQT